MSDSGMPLLSGPPPSTDNMRTNSSACRKCNKEFILLFNRSKKCQHCGYSYCPTCSDYQALMPRHGTAGGVSGTATGYDVVNVCAFCIEHLQITAGGKNYLKSLPLSKLRKYANAYNIRIDRAVEKDDIIEGVMSARGPNGCLSPENERFYRKYSVPDRTAGGAARPRGIFSRSGETPTASARATNNVPPRPVQQSRPEFPRPDLEPDPPHPPPHQEHHQPPPSTPGPNSPPRWEHPPPPTPQWEYRPPPQPPQPPQWEYRPPQPHQQWSYHPPPPPQWEYRPPPQPQWQYRPPAPPSSPQHPGSNTWGHLPQHPPQPDYYNYSTMPTHPYPQPNYPPPPHPPPPSTSTRPSPPHPQYHTHPQEPTSSPPRPVSAHPPHPPPSPRRQSQSQPPPQPQPQPPQSQPRRPWSQSQSQPTLDDLLSMDPSDIHSLSISILKSILFTNHVNVNATMVLEKGDLVQRVIQLVDDERRERERTRQANEDEMEAERERTRAEEERYVEMVREAERMSLAEAMGREHEHPGEEHGEEGDFHHAPSGEGASSPPPPRPTSPPSSLTADKKPMYKDRGGLCVICQDEEANIAIVDCGHLAMCRGCSDLVMASSRECPLCRTRIVTEARLLRIFKT